MKFVKLAWFTFRERHVFAFTVVKLFSFESGRENRLQGSLPFLPSRIVPSKSSNRRNNIKL